VKITALDTETELIRPGVLAPRCVCVSWAADGGAGVVHHSDPAALPLVAEAIEGITVYANAPYDLAVLICRWPELAPAIWRALEDGRICDVQTRQKLIDLAAGKLDKNRRAYSLAGLSLRHLDRALEKDTWRLRYGELIDIPIEQWPEGAKAYATDDARATLDVYNAQEPLKKWAENEAAQVRAHWALHLIACWGVRTDGPRVDALGAALQAEADSILDRLVRAGMARSDGSRLPKGAVRRMAEVMGERAPLTAKAQKEEARGMGRRQIVDRAIAEGVGLSVTTDTATESGDQLLIEYARYGQIQSTISGPVAALKKGATEPIQTRFEVLMETGRTSSSGPNLQNIRREPGIRECFTPRPGWVYVAADYAAAELHTLAQVCRDLFGESKLGDALNDGIDVHTLVGSQLLRIEYADAVALIAEGDPEAKDARQLAKAANFGFPGGCSAGTFCAIAKGFGIEIDPRRAAELRASWLTAWPEMGAFFRHVSGLEDRRHGGHWVKQIRAPRVRGRASYTAACNSFFQGLAADGAKAALFQVAKEQHADPSSALFGTRSVFFIHDEIIIEAPEDQAADAADRLVSVMVEQFGKFTPDVPPKAEAVIMRYWSKDAKPVRDQDGRLIPWG
jgi:hypothetical protein